MKIRFALLMLLPVMVGCAATQSRTRPVPPRMHDLEVSDKVGPADHLYGASERDFSQAQMYEDILADMATRMANKRALIAGLIEKAAAVRQMPHIGPIERKSRHDAYMGDIRAHQRQLLYDQAMVSDLRLQVGALMGRSHLQQIRAAEVERGNVPSASY